MTDLKIQSQSGAGGQPAPFAEAADGGTPPRPEPAPMSPGAGSPYSAALKGVALPDPAPSGAPTDGAGKAPRPNEVIFSRVGKKLAGRLLDGIEHNAMPSQAADRGGLAL